MDHGLPSGAVRWEKHTCEIASLRSSYFCQEGLLFFLLPSRYLDIGRNINYTLQISVLSQLGN
jgi:hypothetical protein